MILPKETGWNYSTQKGRGNTSVFATNNPNSQIHTVKVSTLGIVSIDIIGSSVPALYKKLETLDTFKPYLGSLNPILLSLGTLHISWTILKIKHPKDADELLNTLFSVVETDFETPMSAIQPYILEAMQSNRPSCSPDERIAGIGVASSHLNQSTFLMSGRPVGNKDSIIWNERNTNKSYDKKHYWTPEDQTLALKEIKIEEQFLGLGHGLLLEIIGCDTTLVERFKTSPILSRTTRASSRSMPRSYVPAIQLPGQRSNGLFTQTSNTLSIEITSLPNGDVVFSHVFDLIEELIPHAASVRPKVKEALEAWGYIDESRVHALYSHADIPKYYSLKYGSVRQKTRSKASISEAAEFFQDRDTISVSRSHALTEDIIRCIETRLITKCRWEYNGDYWDSSQRVYQDIHFYSAKHARLVYNKLEASPSKQKARCWEVSLKDKTISMNRFPAMIALAEMLYADRQYRELIEDHIQLSKLSIRLDPNIVSCPLISDQSAIEESIAMRQEDVNLATPTVALARVSAVNGTMFCANQEADSMLNKSETDHEKDHSDDLKI